MSDGANLGSARGTITLDITGLTRAISSAQKQLQGFEASSHGIGSALDGIASKAGLLGAAIGVGVGFAVKTFASFESTLSGVGASLGGVGTAAGITEAQFSALTETAKRIGQDTAFSASEAASAMDVLAKAGISADQIINGVADASVNLAAAIGEGIPQSAEAIAAALATFSLSAADAANITDTLTAALNSSQTNLTDFMAGLRNLGPAMANLGISFQDTAAAIAYFTKFSLKGADVGVSLARAIDNLAKPTDEAGLLMHKLGIEAFDLQHNFVGFPALMDQLNKALAGASDETKAYALQTIFGAEAADVMAIAVREGGDGLRDMTSNLTPAGQAATQAAARLDNLAGSLEKMRGSIETAAIAFGSNLAPAIEKGAGLVEGLANAFSTLPGVVQQTAAVFVGLTGVLALLAAGTAKTISLAIETAATWRKTTEAIKNSERAMRALSFATSPAGIAVVALAVAIGILIRKHQQAVEEARKHREAIEQLKASFESLDKLIASLRIEGLTDAAAAIEQLKGQLELAVNLLNAAADAAARGELGDFGETIKKFGGNVDVMRAAASAMAAALGPMQEAMQAAGIDTVALARDFDTLVDQLLNNDITAEEFTAQVTELTTHLDKYKTKTKDAADATNDLTTAEIETSKAAKDAAEAQKKFTEQLDEVTQTALNTIRGIEDIAPVLDGMQEGFNKAGTSAERALLHLDKIGQIDLTPGQRQALKLAEDLDQVEAAIARTTDAISENQDDLSMWEGRISTVTDVLGGNTDQLDTWIKQLQNGEITQQQFNDAVANPEFVATFDKLDALLASGAISQSKYNQAKAAGIHLLQRSAGGIQDENAELVDNLIALDGYVKEHDDANGAVNNLTDAQRGFIAALQSSQGLLFLQTLQVLLYLESMGQIPEEKVTKFIADSAQADPVVGALIDDLDLIPDETTTDITANDQASGILGGVKKKLDDIPPETDAKVIVTVTGDGTDVAGSLEGVAETIPIATKLAPPDDSAVTSYQPPTIEIPTKLGIPTTAVITEIEPPTVTIPTKYGVPGAAGSEGVAVQGPRAVTIPTKLGDIDTATLDAYTPAAVVVPVELGTVPVTPDTVMAAVVVPIELGTVPDLPATEAPETITIPTAFGAPDTTNIDDITILPTVIPTVYSAPTWPEGAVVQAPRAITIPIKADREAFDDTLWDAIVAAQGFEDTTFTTTLGADEEKVNQTIDTLTGGEGKLHWFEFTTFTTKLDADSAPLDSKLATVRMALWALANSRYSTTIDINIQPALDKIAQLARNLPSSPAEEGPLSKVPNFDYVPESLVRSLTAAAPKVNRALSGLMTDSVRGASLNPFTMGGGLSGVPVGGGTASRSSVVNNTQFIALTAADLNRLLDKSERGAAAFDFIDGGRRY